MDELAFQRLLRRVDREIPARRRSFSGLRPMAAAAVLLLGVGLSIQVYRQQPAERFEDLRLPVPAATEEIAPPASHKPASAPLPAASVEQAPEMIAAPPDPVDEEKEVAKAQERRLIAKRQLESHATKKMPLAKPKQAVAAEALEQPSLQSAPFAGGADALMDRPAGARMETESDARATTRINVPKRKTERIERLIHGQKGIIVLARAGDAPVRLIRLRCMTTAACDAIRQALEHARAASQIRPGVDVELRFVDQGGAP